MDSIGPSLFASLPKDFFDQCLRNSEVVGEKCIDHAAHACKETLIFRTQQNGERSGDRLIELARDPPRLLIIEDQACR